MPPITTTPPYCFPLSIICQLFCMSVTRTITHSVPESCSESIRLDRVTHLPVTFQYVCSEIWNHLTRCVFSNSASACTHRHQKRTILSPAAFKASLDRPGCSWKALFQPSRGQTHLRGKRGLKKVQGHVWRLAYNILHLFPFFLPMTALASFERLWRQWSCELVVRLVTPTSPSWLICGAFI